MPAKFELIAPCFFGCESTAKFELTRIGAENIRVDDGRLSFAGGAEMIAAANLNLRTVERVMLLLARYRAATFDDLFDGVYDIPWEELLPADAAFPVTGSSLNSQLSSVPACQSIIKKDCGQAPDGKAPHLCAAGDRRGVQDPLHAAQGSV